MNTNIPDERSQALFLNIVLSGLGQLYLRQWGLGIILSSIFLASFVGLLPAFATVIQSYFGILTGDTLKGDFGAHIRGALHLPWILSPGLVSFADMIASMVMVWTLKPVE